MKVSTPALLISKVSGVESPHVPLDPGPFGVFRLEGPHRTRAVLIIVYVFGALGYAFVRRLNGVVRVRKGLVIYQK